MTETKRQQTYILLGQIIAHLSIIPMILLASWWMWIAAIIMFCLFFGLGSSITFHRYLAHRSWKMPRWLEWFGSLCGTLALQSSSITWVSMHKDHHAHSDRPGDPHSPSDGFIKAYFLSMFYQPKIFYVRHLIRDRLHVALHKHYWKINIAFSVILFLINPLFPVVFHLFPAMLNWHSVSFINGPTHLWGYRNFDTKDNSRNMNGLAAILTFGESLHNNHHKNPSNYNFAVKPGEIDLGAKIIGMFKNV